MTADARAAHDERRQLLARSARILDRCKAEGGRNLTAEEGEEFNRLHDRAEELRPHQDAAGPDAARAPRPGGAGPKLIGVHRGRLVLGERRDPVYGTEFLDYVRAGLPGASLQTDLASNGGYLAPPEFTLDVVRELDAKFWFRGLCNVLPPTTAPKVVRPRRTGRPDGFLWTTELATPAPDAGYKLGTYELAPHYQSCEFELSADLLRAVPTAPDVLREEIARRAGDAEEAAFVAGTGAGQPLGLFTPDANGVGPDRDVVVDVGDFAAVRGVKFGLRSPYLRSDSLRWVAHPNAARVLCGLKAANGELLWRPSPAPGVPDSVDGVAVAYSDAAPAGTGPNKTYLTGDYFGLVGDLGFYDVQDGLALTVTRLTDGWLARRNMVGFVVRRKVDGCPRVGEAFTRVKVQ